MKRRFSALAAGLLILSFLPSCSPEQPVLREVSYLPPKPVYTVRRVTLGAPPDELGCGEGESLERGALWGYGDRLYTLYGCREEMAQFSSGVQITAHDAAGRPDRVLYADRNARFHGEGGVTSQAVFWTEYAGPGKGAWCLKLCRLSGGGAETLFTQDEEEPLPYSVTEDRVYWLQDDRMFIYDVHSGRTDSRPAKLEAARIVGAEGEAWVLRGEEGGLELWNPEKQTVTASYRLPPEMLWKRVYVGGRFIVINDFEQSYYLLDRKHGSLTRLFKPGDYAIRSPLVVENSFLFAAGEGICCVDLEENRLYPALADESARSAELLPLLDGGGVYWADGESAWILPTA